MAETIKVRKKKVEPEAVVQPEAPVVTTAATEARMHKDIAELIKKGKTVLGSRSVIRQAKGSNLSAVYMASNCPEEMKKQLAVYAALGNFTIHRLEANSVVLGEICGKPFTTLALGVRK